jgi:hypothetical protein
MNDALRLLKDTVDGTGFDFRAELSSSGPATTAPSSGTVVLWRRVGLVQFEVQVAPTMHTEIFYSCVRRRVRLTRSAPRRSAASTRVACKTSAQHLAVSAGAGMHWVFVRCFVCGLVVFLWQTSSLRDRTAPGVDPRPMAAVGTRARTHRPAIAPGRLKTISLLV